ncbi:cytochrome P450 [Microbispora hainanensis]|uniref:Cytochrome P450 n=1 Tax=Microbispora hainanensis TaxID=568844 RepID=A0A544Z2P1_9ACTN|nr:cytochrome P450 [Microbispora hainanensis]TQS23324.1 cytochrome P450 [Microbispora hainanensis]
MTAQETEQAKGLRFPFASPCPGEPAPEFDRLRAGRPVTQVTLPTGDVAWLVTRHADNRTVLSDARFSRALTTRPGAPRLQPIPPDPNSVFSMDPPEHTRLRRLVSPAFGSRRMAALRPVIEREVDLLVDRMVETGPPADLVSGFARRLPITVICELLGVPAGDRERIAGWVDVLLSLTTFEPSQVAQARADLKRYLAELIAVKRDKPSDDLFSELIEARDAAGLLSEEELVMMGATVLTGGFLSTASEIALSFLCLLRHPDQLSLLRARPGLLSSAVDELLRYNALTTGGGLIRVATEDVRLGEVTIKAGEGVLPAISAANRDPDVFDDPHRFDVSREGGPHLTFGLGIHYCLGARLARIELEVALDVTLRRLPGLRLSVPLTELRPQGGHLIRGLPELPVTW